VRWVLRKLHSVGLREKVAKAQARKSVFRARADGRGKRGGVRVVEV